MSTSVETEPADQAPLEKLRDVPPKAKWRLALVLVLTVVAAVVLLLLPAPVAAVAVNAAVMAAMAAGTLKFGALGLLWFRRRRWLLSFLLWVAALCFSLLVLAWMGYVVEAIRAL